MRCDAFTGIMRSEFLLGPDRGKCLVVGDGRGVRAGARGHHQERYAGPDRRFQGECSASGEDSGGCDRESSKAISS